MLYAPIGKDQWPLGFEEVEYLQNALLNYATPASSIQVVIEQGMFGGGVDLKFVIIEWSDLKRPTNLHDRTVLGEYTNVKELTGKLRLLLGIAKDAYAARSALVSKSIYEMYKKGVNKC